VPQRPAPSADHALSSLVDAYTNKIVRFRFRGKDLAFRLSHALFSSNDIDEGTRLLLKSIALRIDLDKVRSAIDIGCGVGVVGASIRAASPGASVILQDRDALAVAFALENWRGNDLGDVRLDCGLGFWHIGGESFDLVASNLPAKAGRPVLESFFRRARGCLAPGGTAAVVIVAPLAEMAMSAVKKLGCDFLHTESTREYAVVHFSAGDADAESAGEAAGDDISPYIRARSPFTHAGTDYELDTAFSLPDFDTAGHGLSLQMDLLANLSGVGSALVWNPGQGHVPAFLVSRTGAGMTGLCLAGRDALECEISRRNVTRLGCTQLGVKTAASEACLPDAFAGKSFDILCAAPHPVPRVPWQAALRESALALLRPGGRLCVAATSTEIHRFLDRTSGFRLLSSVKRHGFRAVLMQRN
jgi:16S rRNA (guanine1207-N2)-methyltransferase